MPKLYRIYRYARFLLDRFKYLILFAAIAFAIATAVLYFYHPDQAKPETHKDLGEVSFGVFELMFASEPALPYPKGSLPSQIVYFALPVLNLLGLAAAVAQFSQILFDHGLYNRAQAEHADGHVILCGLGRLGREVLRQLDRRHRLKRKHDVVIVDDGTGLHDLDSELVTHEPIIPVIRGDMAHPDTLRAARVDRAVAVVLMTGDDTANLEAALLANELNPHARIVLRMSNKRVSQRLDALFRRSPTKGFHLIDSVEGSAPKCTELCDLLFPQPDQPAQSIRPLPDVPPRIDPPEIAPFPAPADPDSSPAQPDVIICGLGRLGFGALRLLRANGRVIVIDSAPHLHYEDEPELTGVRIVHADMTHKRTLLEAGVESARAILILTPNDTENLEAAMVAHDLNPTARIVLRINNSRISRRLEGVLRDAFGDTLRVIDPAQHAAPHFVNAVSQAYEGA